MNLLQLLLGSLASKESVESTSKKTGVKSNDVSKLLMIAIPLLISYMTRNAAKKEGATSLFNALNQHNNSQNLAQQVADADETDGGKIIAHILGKDQDNVVQSLAQASNLSSNQVSSVLSTIAPALLAGLATATFTSSKKKKKADKVDLSDGIDLSDIAAILGSSSNSNQAADLLGTLLNAGAKQETSPLSSILGAVTGSAASQKQADGSELLSILASLAK